MSRSQYSDAKMKEAFGTYHFAVEINSGKYAGGGKYNFHACTGLKWESKVEAYQEGGVNSTPRKLIGFGDYPPIVLRHGFAAPNSQLWAMRQRYVNDTRGGKDNGKNREIPLRFNGTIIQLGPYENTAKWYFENAWISKWEGPDFDAKKAEISIESIEITHEGLWLVSGKPVGEG